VAKANSELNIIISIKDKASSKLKRFRKAFLEVATAMGIVIGAAVALKKAFDFSKAGAQLKRLETASNKLAAGMGGNMQSIVASMRDASNSTIDNYTLMETANKALLLGVAKTPGEFAKLTAASIALGRAMGRGPAEAISDITIGIGRLSPKILDNLGILTKDMPEGLTEVEKKQFLLNKTMQAAEPLLDKNGKLVGDMATNYEKLEANIKNTEGSFKRYIATLMDNDMSWFNEILHEIGGELDFQTFVLEQGINTFALSNEAIDKLRQTYEETLVPVEGFRSQQEAIDYYMGLVTQEAGNQATALMEVGLAMRDWSDDALAATLVAGLWAKAIDDGFVSQDEVDKIMEVGKAMESDVADGIGQARDNFNQFHGDLASGEDITDRLLNTLNTIEAKGIIDVEFNIITRGSVPSPDEFGYQHGGTFTVPGGFPRDSFKMGASSGEQVTVGNRDNRSFFGGANVNINNGTDLEGFEALLRQIQ